MIFGPEDEDSLVSPYLNVMISGIFLLEVIWTIISRGLLATTFPYPFRDEDSLRMKMCV